MKIFLILTTFTGYYGMAYFLNKVHPDLLNAFIIYLILNLITSSIYSALKAQQNKQLEEHLKKVSQDSKLKDLFKDIED